MIIAVDIGTSSIKTGLVDEEGRVASTVVYDVPLTRPTPLAAEHDLELVWRLVIRSIKEVARGFENRVEAVVFSNYLHGLALLDENYRVVWNVMTHLDRRCATEQKILEEVGYDLYNRTGCPPIFVFPICKALWLSKKGFFRKNMRLSFVKDYVLFRLTGVHAVDNGVASGTGLQNVHSLKWDDHALGLLGIDESNLPTLVEPGEVLDYVDIPDAGLNKVAVIPGSFDGAVQNVGFGVREENAVLNLGSTAVVRTLTKSLVLDKSREMRFFAYYAVDGYRAIGGASNNGMTVVDWLKKLVSADLELPEHPACTDGVYVLPFLSGERYPFRDPNLTFTVHGLRLEHGREHLFKAVIEGIAFTVGYILKSIEENGRSISTLHCAGGGCLNAGIVKTFSNVLCKPIAVYEVSRAAGLIGSAAIALKALGRARSALEAGEALRGAYRLVEPERSLCRDYEHCLSKFLKLVENARGISPQILPLDRELV